MLDHRALVQAADKLPALPVTATRLLSLMSEATPDLKEVSNVLSYDPAMSARLLKLSNSAWAGCSIRIGTVREAVMRLGINTVFGLAIGAFAQPVLNQPVRGYGIDGEAFWRHSVAAALAAEEAEHYSGVVWPTFAFTAALLHDIGKLVLGPFITPERRHLIERAIVDGNLEFYQAETEILSAHHGEVGALVGQHWNLPPTVIDGMRCHHTPDLASENIGHVVNLANGVTRQLDGKPLGHIGESLETLMICTEDFQHLCQSVKSGVQELLARFR